MNTIRYCPRCGQDAILKESYFGEGVFVACEICEWSFYMYDRGDIDTHELGRMLEDRQKKFEREANSRPPEPASRTLKRIMAREGYPVMESPARRDSAGHVKATWPNDRDGRMVTA